MGPMHAPEPAPQVPEPAGESLDPIAVRRRQLQARQADLRRHLESLRRDQRRVPWLLLGLLLTVPAGWWWGVKGAALVTIGTLILVGSAAYLIWGHRVEYEQKLAEVAAELRRL